MEMILFVAAVLAILWWRFPQIISASLKPTYRCIFKKNIVVPERDFHESVGLIMRGGVCDLTKVVDLPFPPQIGMSLSDFTELSILSPEDKSYVDGMKFESGKIEDLNWKHDRRVFECIIADYELSGKAELGAVLAKHVVGGWSVKGSISISITKDAIDEFLATWLKRIEDKENETHQPLPVDRKELNRVHVILRHSDSR